MIDVIQLVDDLTEAGIDATVANTGLKSALAQMVEDGITPSKEALEDLIEQVAGPDGLNVAIEYFGAKAGPAFFQAIQDGSITVQSFSGDIDGVTGAIDKTKTATDGWEQSWNTIKNTITTSLVPLGDVIKDFLDEHGAAFAEWFTKTVPAAVESAIQALDSFFESDFFKRFQLNPAAAVSTGTGNWLENLAQEHAAEGSPLQYPLQALANRLQQREWVFGGPAGGPAGEPNAQYTGGVASDRGPYSGAGGLQGGDTFAQPGSIDMVTGYSKSGGIFVTNHVYGNVSTTDLQNSIDNAIQGQGVPVILERFGSYTFPIYNVGDTLGAETRAEMYSTPIGGFDPNGNEDAADRPGTIVRRCEICEPHSEHGLPDGAGCG